MPRAKKEEDSKRTRVNIFFDEEVLKQIDGFAKKNGITRTGAVSILCMQSLEQKQAMDSMKWLEMNMGLLQQMSDKSKE